MPAQHTATRPAHQPLSHRAKAGAGPADASVVLESRHFFLQTVQAVCRAAARSDHQRCGRGGSRFEWKTGQHHRFRLPNTRGAVLFFSRAQARSGQQRRPDWASFGCHAGRAGEKRQAGRTYLWLLCHRPKLVFPRLADKLYTIATPFATTGTEVFDVFRVLKALKARIEERVA